MPVYAPAAAHPEPPITKYNDEHNGEMGCQMTTHFYVLVIYQPKDEPNMLT